MVYHREYFTQLELQLMLLLFTTILYVFKYMISSLSSTFKLYDCSGLSSFSSS